MRWNKRKGIMEIKQYLSDILLTVLLSWKAILWRLRDFHDTGRGSSYSLSLVKLQLPLVLIYYRVPLQGNIISKHVTVFYGLHFIGQGTGCLKISASTQQLHICADYTGSTQKKSYSIHKNMNYWDVTVLLRVTTWLLAPCKLKLVTCICNIPMITVPAQSAGKPSSGFL